MWDKVYAGINPIEVEMQADDGTRFIMPVISFRMIAEIDGRAFLATHVITQESYEDFPQQYGFILDEMVEFIDRQAGLIP